MNSNINWQLRIRDNVYKQIVKFPLKDQKRLLKAIEFLPSNPFAGDIQKMEREENIWRRRVGSYRIRYEVIVRDSVIYVFLVERRTSKTY